MGIAAVIAYSNRDLGDPGISPNEFLHVVFPSGIASVTITGDPAGKSFVLDDATITTPAASVPEPTSILFLSLGLALGILRRRHIHL
jgi:hypothetical protein